MELHIFDTAGQDVFAEMMPEYWQEAKGVVLVYDVTRRETFENVRRMFMEADQNGDRVGLDDFRPVPPPGGSVAYTP